MLKKSAERLTTLNRAQAWSSVLFGIAELLPIVPNDQPITYESVVSADLIQRSMTAMELHRRGLMEIDLMLTILTTSSEIHKFNDSALPQKRRRGLVHELLQAQDEIIRGDKYA